MKSLKLSVLILPLFFFFPSLSEAQQMQRMEFDASTSMMLQEFQAMLVFENDEIAVRMRMGGGEAEEGVDRLEQGDVILMMNGKRATDIETLRSIYESVEADQEIKIGVRRGNERFILNAIKGDVPEGGPRMMMTFDTDDGPPPAIVPELGAMLADRDGSVVLERVIPPIQPEELKAFEIEGYTIKELNGDKPENADQVRQTLEALEVGAEISITLEKDGDEKNIVFTKQEPRGAFSISTDNN
ncbi:MAG: hypothetical protein JJ971_16225 [Balneolaceae bacterium]|nr:hypothetical protein [Balneolaceae bacterium]MBO6547949.1 hypothetical protein [Balneolaceae bacterium]MBO6648462.1 hypothetical protein [Balneolaceae bacterium]